MFDRDRRNYITTIVTAIFYIAVVFFVGWTTIELKTGQRVSEHYARQDEASIRPEDVHLSCDGLPPDKITECVIKKYEEHEKWDQDRRDLHAQEDMALWAFWMLIFTAGALVAILRTLHHTRRAADYTQDMLIEASATTKAAQDTLKSDRAWMTFDHFSSKPAGNSERLGGAVTGVLFDFHFTNTGRSPAFIKSIASQIKFSQTPLIIPEFPDVPIPKNDGTPTIGPGRKQATIDILIELEYLKRVFDGDGFMFMHCIVRYEDIWGEKRITEVTLQIDFAMEFNSILVKPYSPNSFTSKGVGKRNICT